jgi:ribonucleotide reductase beta subunit family protein with ferritin-like domain
MLYPILKKHNEVLALSAILFREAIEAISYAVMVISMLLMVTVSELYENAGAADTFNIQILGTMLTATKDWTEMWGRSPSVSAR